ncbi:hypothetical protein ACUY2X_06885 [Corynebacterium minutissimum]|uniref:hypothetical protein n=1 Tax=Corynebacterium sp. MSK218 TaxID=3050218 RepID=UPI00254D81D6|nr:hypothetical protein [Corynebacterium sp. MSK218]MDK8763447.1 hypothetical protein [Corynebacterium sp. MSK218]
MRRVSMRVGLSVFASATLLGGGAVASAFEVAPEEQCQLSSVLNSEDGTAAESSDALAGLSSQNAVAAECGAAADAPAVGGSSAPVTGAATQATMFGGISLALISASAAFAGIDWTPILIKLGSWF